MKIRQRVGLLMFIFSTTMLILMSIAPRETDMAIVIIFFFLFAVGAIFFSSE